MLLHDHTQLMPASISTVQYFHGREVFHALFLMGFGFDGSLNPTKLNWLLHNNDPGSSLSWCEAGLLCVIAQDK